MLGGKREQTRLGPAEKGSTKSNRTRDEARGRHKREGGKKRA